MAGTNLNTWYAKLKDKGVLLQNFWKFTLLTSDTGDSSIDRDLALMSFYVLDCNLPGVTQNNNNVPWLGKNFYVPGTFQPDQECTMIVRCDRDQTIRKALLKWCDAISNHGHLEGLNNATMGGIKFPSSEAEMILLSDQGQNTTPFNQVTRSYKFVGIYPSEVGEIDLQNSADPKVATFAVKFSFQYFTDKR